MLKCMFHLDGLVKSGLGRVTFVLAILVSLPMFAGCPDYSDQRPVPNYENMTDGGSDEEGGGDEVDN